ncbi:MAG: YkvA family protein [Gemmatimonadaceae bacterium]
MPTTPRSRRAPAARKPATGQKRTVMGALRELPNFVRLMYGLLSDPRVATVDKLLVAGAVAYVALPMDLIPDFIPFIGEVDDVFVVVMALRRLMQNAGPTVLMDHWMGDPEELEDLNLQRVLAAAAFFLPRSVRRRLRTIGRV